MGEPDTKLLLWLLFGIGAGIFAFGRGFWLAQRKRLIENIPTSKVRSVAMGLVEVEGKAEVYKRHWETPFSKTQCVYYRYRVEELRGSGKRCHWVTVAQYETPGWFYLQDETGKVLVNPKGAELHLAVDRKYSTGFLVSSSQEEAFKKGLELMGINWRSFLGFEKRLRSEETFIQAGDHVYVIGTATDNPRVALSERGMDNVLIGKADSIYLISDRSEKELLSSFRVDMLLCLYGGPLVTVICLFFLVMLYFN